MSGADASSTPPSPIGVVPAGAGRMLLELCLRVLGAAAEAPVTDPSGLAQWRRPDDRHRVILLIDPIGDEWTAAVEELRRREPRVGVVVLTARPAYWVQRHWRARLPAQDVGRADALLSLQTNGVEDLRAAIRDAALRPGRRSGHWLDEYPEHPYAFYGAGPQGAAARDVHERPDLHRTLALYADGFARDVVAERLGIQGDTASARIKQLRDDFGVANDVALGHLATRFGLLDDRPRTP